MLNYKPKNSPQYFVFHLVLPEQKLQILLVLHLSLWFHSGLTSLPSRNDQQ